MPSRPPGLFGKPKAATHNWSTKSAEDRGYGREHRRLRKQVLDEEPLCRVCERNGRIEPSTTADHILPLSRGGRTARSNMQGLCIPCHRAKTAQEAQAGAARTR